MSVGIKMDVCKILDWHEKKGNNIITEISLDDDILFCSIQVGSVDSVLLDVRPEYRIAVVIPVQRHGWFYILHRDYLNVLNTKNIAINSNLNYHYTYLKTKKLN